MKLLKPTLSKKIFLLLLVSFCLINVVNVFLDFDREKYHAYENLEDSYLHALTNQIQNDYQNQDNQFNQSFFSNIHKTLTQRESMNYKNVMILDNQLNMIYSEYSHYAPQLTLSKSLEQVDSTYQLRYVFELTHLDQPTKNKLEEVLKNKFKNQPFVVQFASVSYSNIKNETVSSVLNDLSYLAIDDHVFFDHRENHEEIEELEFYNYDSENIFISVPQFYPRDRLGYHVINYQEIRENAMNSLKGALPLNTSDITSLDNQFEKDGTLYTVKCLPLIKKEIQTNEEDNHSLDIQGYLIYYSYDFQAIERIIDDVILSKLPTYGLSFIFVVGLCLLLSYMLTRRIKKMNHSTLAIANNQFDIHLDEKSKDELGVLSHNINYMSQQLKQTIDKLNEEIERVKHLESVRKEFIANFTHEIKTPLGIMNGYIELIEVMNDEEKKRDYLKAIEEEIKRIDELVKAMLNLSRLESGHVNFHIQTVDLEELLTSSIESFAPLLEKKKIKIHLEGEFESIEADIFELQIAIMNFISNAIKHTKYQGNIYISYQNHILSIENEGELLTEQQKSRIWDTYVSGDREGTGLGLAICQMILDLHGFGYHVQNTHRGVQFQIIFQ